MRSSERRVGRSRRGVGRAAGLGPAPEEAARALGGAREVRPVRDAMVTSAIDPARAILAVAVGAGEQPAEVTLAIDELAEQHRVTVAALAEHAAHVADRRAVLVGHHAEEPA